MAFDLPRAPRQLRFTGGVRAVDREPAPSSPWDAPPNRPGVRGPAGQSPPETAPLARPRAKLGPPPPKPWEPDEEDLPTTIHHSAVAGGPPPAFTPPPAAGTPAQPRVARPIPNFRPAPSAPPGMMGAVQRGRSAPTRTRPSRRKRAKISLPLFAWLLLAVVCGSISFFVAPPLVDRLGAVAFHKAAAPAR